MISTDKCRFAMSQNRAFLGNGLTLEVSLVSGCTSKRSRGSRISWDMNILFGYVPLPEIIMVSGIPIEFGSWGSKTASMFDNYNWRTLTTICKIHIVRSVSTELATDMVSLRGHSFPWLHVLGLLPIVHTVSCVWLHWTCYLNPGNRAHWLTWTKAVFDKIISVGGIAIQLSIWVCRRRTVPHKPLWHWPFWKLGSILQFHALVIVSVHWCMLGWTFVIPTIAELANTYSSSLTTFMVIRARLIPHVIILAYSNSKFISDYITHTWSDFHMVKSQLSANDWLAVEIRMCTPVTCFILWKKIPCK